MRTYPHTLIHTGHTNTWRDIPCLPTHPTHYSHLMLRLALPHLWCRYTHAITCGCTCRITTLTVRHYTNPYEALCIRLYVPIRVYVRMYRTYQTHHIIYPMKVDISSQTTQTEYMCTTIMYPHIQVTLICSITYSISLGHIGHTGMIHAQTPRLGGYGRYRHTLESVFALR